MQYYKAPNLETTMKCLLIIVFILLGTLAFPSDEELQAKWDTFKKTHQKSYSTIKETKRKNIFKDNLQKIEEHNKLYEENKVTYALAINQFADITNEEFIQTLAYRSPRSRSGNIKTVEFEPVNIQTPNEIDWRDRGAVTEIKNQGQCGGCWAYSVTGSLEGANYLKHGRLVSFSKQELLDCSTETGNEGCDGGFMEQGFEYIKKHGLVTEDEYPQEVYDKLCQRGDIPAAVNIDSYVVLPTEDEESLKQAVGTKGPVSVAVDATDWQFYSRGIFFDSDCRSANESLNHGVLAVGYGGQSSEKYWLVKNSWGASWGEAGYIRMARSADNNCGIATDACYPIVM